MVICIELHTSIILIILQNGWGTRACFIIFTWGRKGFNNSCIHAMCTSLTEPCFALIFHMHRLVPNAPILSTPCPCTYLSECLENVDDTDGYLLAELFSILLVLIANHCTNHCTTPIKYYIIGTCTVPCTVQFKPQ